MINFDITFRDGDFGHIEITDPDLRLLSQTEARTVIPGICTELAREYRVVVIGMESLRPGFFVRFLSPIEK